LERLFSHGAIFGLPVASEQATFQALVCLNPVHLKDNHKRGHMHKLVPILVLIATAAIAVRAPVAAELRSVGTLSNPSGVGISGADAAIVLVGGMGGGGTGGGMGGGGMGGGMMGGGTGGGMMGGGMTGYSGMPGSGVGRPNGGGDTSGGGAQPTQYHQCVTQYGQCTVTSSPGALQRGVSCSCSYGGRGKIK
jgi:hypothetical protein